MTIKNLISYLSTFPQDMSVYITYDGQIELLEDWLIGVTDYLDGEPVKEPVLFLG